MRAGAGGLFLFRSDPSQVIEVWEADYTINVKNTPRKSLDESEIFARLPINKQSLKTLLISVMENGIMSAKEIMFFTDPHVGKTLVSNTTPLLVNGYLASSQRFHLR